MNTEQFIERIIAPGPYIAVMQKGERGVFHRFFPRQDVASAASYMKWANGKGIETWIATAAYRMAIPGKDDARGRPTYTGERKAVNAHSSKVFWIDLDVKRAGDGKDPSKVYATAADAVKWLVQVFCPASSMPLPNLWVNSGYGLHVYWVLEDALTPADWQPYADALEVACTQHGMTGDIGLSGDIARVLRAPGTSNFKLADQPVPVETLPKMTRGDYPNEMIFACLQPYLGQVVRKPQVFAAQAAGSVLAGGNVSSIFAGRQSTSTQAATANVPSSRRTHLMSEIVKKCRQVATSLANNGNGENRPLWYLGNLTLAAFCDDGDKFIHEMGKGDPRYSAHETDTAFATIKSEITSKGIGAPTCQHYNRQRPGVCDTCPFNGRIPSPYSLGVEDGDLPDGYRRHNGKVQKAVQVKDGITWETFLNGNVYAPMLDRSGDAHTLSFTYELVGHTSRVVCGNIPGDTARLIEMFRQMGITLDRHTAVHMWDFVMAWISKLRAQGAVRVDPVAPFGWATKGDGSIVGLGVGGTLYRSDGSTEAAPGGDRNIVQQYRPHGDMAAWRAAADLVMKDRPDLQTIVAASFGAPLMHFTGEPGMFLSCWSRDSGVGKSSAFKVGQTVWGSQSAMCSMKDTQNAVRAKIGATRIMPAYWDEMYADADTAKATVDLIFELTQGKDKARMNSDTSLREVGEWETIMVVSGNQPLMDHIVAVRSNTDAGALRAFEYYIDKPPFALDPNAGAVLGKLKNHYGHAGPIYAAFLAQNVATVESNVQQLSNKLARDLMATNGERFFIAGMSCILLGALYANQLKLASFDTTELTAFLKRQFVLLRERRGTDLAVSNGVMDVDGLLGAFMHEFSAQRLVTNIIPMGGPTPTKLAVMRAPASTNAPIVIQIGKQQRIMRIERGTFDGWARRRGIPSSDLVNQIKAKWGCYMTRGVMGAGTAYATGRVFFYEIGLNFPELEDYLFEDGAPSSQQATAAPALAAASAPSGP